MKFKVGETVMSVTNGGVLDARAGLKGTVTKVKKELDGYYVLFPEYFTVPTYWKENELAPLPPSEPVLSLTLSDAKRLAEDNLVIRAALIKIWPQEFEKEPVEEKESDWEPIMPEISAIICLDFRVYLKAIFNGEEIAILRKDGTWEVFLDKYRVTVKNNLSTSTAFFIFERRTRT
ncbi:MAG: hypothetical protein WC329_07665 [Candidatus Omnitrophota bacterium]|jgi:hypothetical protein